MSGPTLVTQARLDRATPYGIERHHHLYAAWAASRGASVKGCWFSVEQGRAILEACGFNAGFCQPDHLPAPADAESKHREWQTTAINSAAAIGLKLTHGVAAKLINLYLKSRFVCGGHHSHERVHHLHPPVDAVLLETLAKRNVGGFARQWRQLARARWSKLDSEEYENVIGLIRKSLDGEPLWKIEEYWKGNQ